MEEHFYEMLNLENINLVYLTNVVEDDDNDEEGENIVTKILNCEINK